MTEIYFFRHSDPLGLPLPQPLNSDVIVQIIDTGKGEQTVSRLGAFD